MWKWKKITFQNTKRPKKKWTDDSIQCLSWSFWQNHITLCVHYKIFPLIFVMKKKKKMAEFILIHCHSEGYIQYQANGKNVDYISILTVQCVDVEIIKVSFYVWVCVCLPWHETQCHENNILAAIFHQPNDVLCWVHASSPSKQTLNADVNWSDISK